MERIKQMEDVARASKFSVGSALFIRKGLMNCTCLNIYMFAGEAKQENKQIMPTYINGSK